MRDRTSVQSAARLVGIAFLVLGAAGFVPGITSDWGDMKFAGDDSRAELLGIFQVSVLHNVVHLLFGVAGLSLARTADGARSFLLGGGALYLALAAYGILVGEDSSSNFVPLNTADDALHVLFGAAMIGLGYASGRGDRDAAGSGAPDAPG